MASAGGSLEAGDVSVRTSIVPPGPCPPPADTPDTSPAAMKQQLTASFHDFAVSLVENLPRNGQSQANCRNFVDSYPLRVAGQFGLDHGKANRDKPHENH